VLIQEDKSIDPDVKATLARLTQFHRFYMSFLQKMPGSQKQHFTWRTGAGLIGGYNKRFLACIG